MQYFPVMEKCRVSNKLNIKKNVITTVTAFFINILLTFVGYKLLVNHGGLEALGLWSILSAAIFIIRIGDVGMGSSAERHVALISIKENPKKLKNYLDTALIINTALFSLLAMIGWLIFSNNLEWIIPGKEAFQQQAYDILPLMFFTFVVSNIANVLTGGIRGLHLGYLSAYLSIAANVLQLLVIIWLVPKIGITGLALGQLAQNILTVIVAWIIIFSTLKKYIKISLFNVSFSKETFKELFSFSLKAQAVNLINGLFEPLSKFIVGHTAGMSFLGLYELAFKIVSLPRNAVVSGVMGVMPAITRLLSQDIKQAKKLYFKTRYLVILATGFTMLMVGLGSPIASYIILHEVNAYLILFVGTIAIGFWFNAIGAPAYTLGFSAGIMKGNLLAAILSLIILIVLSFTTQMIWPNYSAVLASAIALAVNGLFVLWRNEKLLGVSEL